MVSETEASDIQNTLASIEYEDSTSTITTGNDFRSASRFLANARESMEAKKSYLELRKNSLFRVLPNMPESIKAVVLEYAIDPEKDYSSKVLTFGRK